MPCLMPALAQAQHSLYPVAPLVCPSLGGAQDSAPCTHVCEAPGARARQRQDPVSFPLNPSPISVLVIETSIKIQVRETFYEGNIYCVPWWVHFYQSVSETCQNLVFLDLLLGTILQRIPIELNCAFFSETAHGTGIASMQTGAADFCNC